MTKTLPTDVSRLNWECKIFKLNKLTPDSFKCLIFAQDLTIKKDAKVRMKILKKLSEECNILKLRHDTEKNPMHRLFTDKTSMVELKDR